jgi:hypothetical protein
MRRSFSVGAIGLALLAVTMAHGQTPQSASPSETLRAHVKGERLDVITSIRGLPLGVRQELQRLWGTSELEIAEPGAAFRDTATADSTLPIRRLAAAACAPDQHCLVYYERGGQTHTWFVALFQWTPAATRLELGGTAPGGLKTLDEVRAALLSGTIRQTGAW